MSEETKFTPGPWHAWRNSSFWQIDAEGFGQIGDTCSSSCSPAYGGSDELGQANARLMAAAPDLHAELTQARTDIAILLAMIQGALDEGEITDDPDDLAILSEIKVGYATPSAALSAARGTYSPQAEAETVSSREDKQP